MNVPLKRTSCKEILNSTVRKKDLTTRYVQNAHACKVVNFANCNKAVLSLHTYPRSYHPITTKISDSFFGRLRDQLLERLRVVDRHYRKWPHP